MKVVNHRLEGVPFVATPNVSGMMNPTGVIMHYTAGYTADSAIKTLCNPATKASAHLVIDTDGTVTQLVPFNRVAWHAGPSVLNGQKNCNGFTIGIEFVNPGYFKIGKSGEIIDAYGKVLDDKAKLRYDLTLKAPNKRIGGGVFIWPGYSKAQITAGKEVFKALCSAYGIKQLAGHEDIDTRGWKTDPGPAFPMGEFKALLHAGEDRSDGMTPAKTRLLVNTPKLNVRAAPNGSGAVITQLAGGSEVVVLQDLGDWSHVEYAPGKKGYVADQYLKKG